MKNKTFMQKQIAFEQMINKAYDLFWEEEKFPVYAFIDECVKILAVNNYGRSETAEFLSMSGKTVYNKRVSCIELSKME